MFLRIEIILYSEPSSTVQATKESQYYSVYKAMCAVIALKISQKGKALLIRNTIATSNKIMTFCLIICKTNSSMFSPTNKCQSQKIKITNFFKLISAFISV